MSVERRALVLRFELTLMAPASATPQLLVSGWDDLRTAPLQTQLPIRWRYDERYLSWLWREEFDHSGLSTVSHGMMSNIEVCDSIIYQKTKLSEVATIPMKQINDIRLNTLVIPLATTQLDTSTIPIHRLQHGHSAMILLIQVPNDFFATKKLVNVFQLQALGLREE